MWMSKTVVEWLNVSLDTVTSLKESNAALTAERDALKNELASIKITSDWFRVQINSLQMERVGLIEKAYHIKLPVPELVKSPTKDIQRDDFSFDDLGDEVARQLGMTTYDTKF